MNIRPFKLLLRNKNMITMMKISYHEHKSALVSTFNDAYFDESNLDLVFLCKNNFIVKAHRLVLASVSEFLKQLILDSNEEIVYISLPDVSHRVIKLLLNYLYCGLTKVNQEELVELKNILTLLGICLPSAIVTTDSSQLSEKSDFQQEVKNSATDTQTTDFKNRNHIQTYGRNYKRIPVIAHVVGNHDVSSSLPTTTHFPIDPVEGMHVDNSLNIPDRDPNVSINDLNVKIERMEDESYESQYIMENTTEENNLSVPPSSFIDTTQEFGTNDIRCRKCGHSLSGADDYQKSIEHCKNCKEKDGISSKPKKPHACNQCNKSFKTRWSLTQHFVVHSTAREFQCPECERFYKSKKHLYEHRTRVHSGPRYTCDQCDKAFKFRSSFNHHRLTVHTDNVFTTVILPPPPPDNDQQ